MRVRSLRLKDFRGFVDEALDLDRLLDGAGGDQRRGQDERARRPHGRGLAPRRRLD
jgi:hypothetical protein